MVRAKNTPKEATNDPSTDTADVDKPLATSRIDQPLTSARSGARTGQQQTSPPRPHQPPSPARKKLRSAAQAANHLIKNAEAASKDRKGAVAAAARLFDLAASDPDTKIEFVAEDGTARGLLTEGVVVGGKTGTAQHGTDPPNSHAWIVGYAGRPEEQPSLAFAVIVEAQEGASEQTGGRVAAPIAQAVIAAVFS